MLNLKANIETLVFGIPTSNEDTSIWKGTKYMVHRSIQSDCMSPWYANKPGMICSIGYYNWLMDIGAWDDFYKEVESETIKISKG